MVDKNWPERQRVTVSTDRASGDYEVTEETDTNLNQISNALNTLIEEQRLTNFLLKGILQ
jgi:hypothetical protein